MDTLTLPVRGGRDAGDLADVLHEHLQNVIGVRRVNGQETVHLASGDRVAVRNGVKVEPRRPRAVLLETKSTLASVEIEHAIVDTVEGTRVLTAGVNDSLLILPDGTRLVLVVHRQLPPKPAPPRGHAIRTVVLDEVPTTPRTDPLLGA